MLYGYELVRYIDRPGHESMRVNVSECELSVCVCEYSTICVGCARVRV